MIGSFVRKEATAGAGGVAPLVALARDGDAAGKVAVKKSLKIPANASNMRDAILAAGFSGCFDW